ncbi:MAG TPA: TonB-dependent receptor [Candidatus Kapabacteria bacterium]|nr:TonB-dependent receptor [Candidatus Kapabacteria bacterium]
MLYKIVFIVLFVFLSINNLYSHNIIKGSVLDSTKRAIAGATIKLEHTTLGAVADKHGDFSIKRVPPGIYNVLISAVGYHSYTLEVDLTHKEDFIHEMKVILSESIVNSSGVVVSATRTDKLYEDVPIKVSVIDNKIFEATQSASIQEGIRFAPGLRVEANCQNCGYSQIRLNGMEGRYSQILIDGKPIITSLNSMYALDQIPSNMIDRVEIVRGGGSALYGGNAIAGVVNIITKPPVENSFEGRYNYGMIDNNSIDYSYQLNASTISDEQDFGVYLFANHNKRDIYDADNDGFSEIPTLSGTSFGARAFLNPDSKSKLTFDFQTIHENRRGGDSIKLPPHETLIAEDLSQNLTAGSLSYESYFNNDLSKYSIYASFNNTEVKDYIGANKDPNGYGLTSSKVYLGGLQFNHILKNFLIGDGIFTSGFEYQNENVLNEASEYRTTLKQEVNLFGLYAQYDWRLNEHFNLISGLRADKHNMIKDLILSPRFTFMYKQVDDFNLRASLSTGYRSPQAYNEDLHTELRSGKRVIVELSQHLQAEKSLSLNWGIDKYLNFENLPIALSFEVFYNKLNNVFVNEASGIDDKGNIVLTKKNGDGATIYGLNAEIRTSYFEYFLLQASITYQKGSYDSPFVWLAADPLKNILEQKTNKILRTPDLYGYVSLYINPSEHLEFILSAIYTGSMDIPHFAGGTSPTGNVITENIVFLSPNFLELNASVSYIFLDRPELKLALGVNNISNQYQDDFDRGPNRDSDFIYGPLKPRTFRASLSVKM